jgi:hypothetical protein
VYARGRTDELHILTLKVVFETGVATGAGMFWQKHQVQHAKATISGHLICLEQSALTKADKM